MSHESYVRLLDSLCEILEIPDPASVRSSGELEVGGFSVSIKYFPVDPSAVYVLFNFGVCTAGRTLTVFRLMLEANVSVYAQDQAQLGLMADGSVVLFVRIPVSNDLNAQEVVEIIEHYAEHGNYWRGSILSASDEAFAGICNGDYVWISV